MTIQQFCTQGTKVFMTEEEYASLSGQQVSNLQEIIEEPVIYMIAPSSSSPELQIALVPDRAECLTELSQPILSNSGVEIYDFFVETPPLDNLKGEPSLGEHTNVAAVGVRI